MPLINCPECSHSVSDKALDCPSCGARLRKPKRGFFGKIFKWLFILFNLFMLIMTFKSCGSASEIIASSQNEYEQAGATLGSTLGLGMVIIFWALVDVILGLFVLFTRQKR